MLVPACAAARSTAVLLGALTGVGGGIARDILVAEIPTVLRADLYAVAALAGAAVVVVGGLCFGLRFMAIRHGWHLPRARQSDWSGSVAPSPRGKDDGLPR